MTEVTFTKHYSSVQRLTTLPINGKPHAFSPADKAVYFYLLAYQESTGKVFPSIPTLAAELGMSQSTIKRSLKFLRETSLIKSERRYDDSNLYSVTFIADVLRLVNTEVKQIKGRSLTVFSTKAIETVLRILGLVGTNFKVGEEWLERRLNMPAVASQEPLGSVKKESAGVSIDHSVEPVKEHSAKSGDMSQEENDVCEWTGERTPKDKRKEQPEDESW